jgi:hypothetical protein
MHPVDIGMRQNYVEYFILMLNLKVLHHGIFLFWHLNSLITCILTSYPPPLSSLLFPIPIAF